MIVVDTNVIAYMTFNSDHSATVNSLHEYNPIWEAPMLWRSEFLNVISLYHKKKLIDETEAMDALDYAERLISKRERQISSNAVIELIVRSKCSSYDCEFVALAKELGTKLVTYDKQILNEFPSIAMNPEAYLAQVK